MRKGSWYYNRKKTSTKYAYYIRGRKLSIVENDGTDWVSPQSVNTFKAEESGSDIEPVGGFLLEYTYLPILPSSETTDIDLDDTLAQALIAYMRASMLEDSGNLESAQYFFRKFRHLTQMSRNNKFGGIRMSTPIDIHAVV